MIKKATAYECTDPKKLDQKSNDWEVGTEVLKAVAFLLDLQY